MGCKTKIGKFTILFSSIDSNLNYIILYAFVYVYLLEYCPTAGTYAQLNNAQL